MGWEWTLNLPIIALVVFLIDIRPHSGWFEQIRTVWALVLGNQPQAQGPGSWGERWVNKKSYWKNIRKVSWILMKPIWAFDICGCRCLHGWIPEYCQAFLQHLQHKSWKRSLVSTGSPHNLQQTNHHQNKPFWPEGPWQEKRCWRVVGVGWKWKGQLEDSNPSNHPVSLVI